MSPCPGPGEATHIYTTADDTAVAVEDLTADWQQERRPRWAIDTGLPATADAPAHEQDLDQRQRANVLAIAAHERTGSDSERTRAAIAAELDRYRARLRAGGLSPVWPEPGWTYSAQTRARQGHRRLERVSAGPARDKVIRADRHELREALEHIAFLDRRENHWRLHIYGDGGGLRLEALAPDFGHQERAHLRGEHRK